MKPRFTIRDLFWLVLVAALIIGWGIDRARRPATEQLTDRIGRLETTLQQVYQNAMVGKTWEDVVRDHHLEQVASWHTPNLPPGADGEATFYLQEGDLTIYHAGEPARIRKVEFRLSDKTPEQRQDELNASWSEWRKAHSN